MSMARLLRTAQNRDNLRNTNVANHDPSLVDADDSLKHSENVAVEDATK